MFSWNWHHYGTFTVSVGLCFHGIGTTMALLRYPWFYVFMELAPLWHFYGIRVFMFSWNWHHYGTFTVSVFLCFHGIGTTMALLRYPWFYVFMRLAPLWHFYGIRGFMFSWNWHHYGTFTVSVVLCFHGIGTTMALLRYPWFHVFMELAPLWHFHGICGFMFSWNRH